MSHPTPEAFPAVMHAPWTGDAAGPSREIELAALADSEASGAALLDEAAATILRGLDCRIAGIARPCPGGIAETLALHGRNGRRQNRRYRLDATACATLYRPEARQHELEIADCRAEGLAVPSFARSLGPLGYLGAAVLDAAGRPIAHVFALFDAAGRSCGCGRHGPAGAGLSGAGLSQAGLSGADRSFFRQVVRQAGFEVRRMLSAEAQASAGSRSGPPAAVPPGPAAAEQARLAAVVESAGSAIIGRGLDGTIFSWNAAAERLFGYCAEEAIGRPITIIYPEGQEAIARDTAGLMVRGDSIVEHEVIRRHKDGHPIPVLVSLAPVRDAAGRVIGVSSISIDRSRRLRREQDLERSEALLQHAQRLGRIGWWTWRAGDPEIKLSTEACRVLGLEPGEGLSPPTLSTYAERFVAAADRETVLEAMSGLGPDDPVASCRHDAVDPKGWTRVVQLWCEAAFDEAGAMVSVNGIVQDVTELVRYREALEFSEARFRDVTEVSSDWVWEADAQGRFEYVSDRIRSVTGLPPEHYLGLSWTDCVADWRGGEPHSLIAEIEGRRPFRDVRLRVATRDGSEAWVAVSGKPRFDAGGRFLGFRGAVADRRGRAAAEAALREAKEAAESANEMKSRFLAAASHDLRQPLHALRLLVTVLGSTRDPDKREAITGEIAGGLASMSSILNALLDVSELDAGGVKPEIAEFALDELFRGVTLAVASRAAEKGLRFVQVPSSARVRSDPALLARIVENFLVNAAQYTETGRVLLGCRRRGDRLRIEVWDTGSGIPPERLDDIFEEFHQLEKRKDDREKGLGLGLAIVRRLADLLGHEIDVRSVPGRGSMFAVEVPLVGGARADVVAAAAAPAGPDLSGTLILLIENGARVRHATQRLLEDWGARVVAATGAQHAMQRVSAWRRAPDLVIADLQLPYGIDGLGAIEALSHRFGHAVPAMILTGEPSSARLREIRRHGVPVLRKPASADSIRSAVTELLSSPMAAE